MTINATDIIPLLGAKYLEFKKTPVISKKFGVLPKGLASDGDYYAFLVFKKLGRIRTPGRGIRFS